MNHDFIIDRRTWMGAMAAGAMTPAPAGWLASATAQETRSPSTIQVGSRRELLVDDELIESLGGAEFKLHRPEPREVSIVCDSPWEGNTSGYYTIFQDDDKFRMIYRGGHVDDKTQKSLHSEYTCYAESRDGIQWTKPNLGLFAFEGSKDNNIIWSGHGSHNFTPFKDTNPQATSEARYKAFGRDVIKVDGKSKSVLDTFQSPDGIHWSIIAREVIKEGAFDSQNLAFWDSHRGEYRAYWRIFSKGVRAIRTATSKDFLHWENQADLNYFESPAEHLYTNAIQPYFRSPHLMIGFPTRFQPKTQQVEPVFMSSRDGLNFRRSRDELIPITAPQDREGNRSNYLTYGLLFLPNNPKELSVYATEAYYAGPGSRVRRFTFRTDGFMSLRTTQPADVVTKPMVFSGSKLSLNITSQGSTRLEIQDPAGRPLPGFSLDNCESITADSIDFIAKWKKGSELRQLAGQPIRLRFALNNADLYAFQFQA